MKKWLICFALMLLAVSNVIAEENSDIYKLSVQSTIKSELKDPQLIKVMHTNPVDSKLYKQKISNEQKQYAENKKEIDADYYNLYKILEKLIRANNLYYQSWRLMLKPETEDINASAGIANLITIYSSLYDSLYDNENALAFILAHELGHFVLGHHQETVEKISKIHELEVSLGVANNNITNHNNMATLNQALGNNYGVLGNQLSSTAYMASIVVINNNINKM